MCLFNNRPNQHHPEAHPPEETENRLCTEEFLCIDLLHATYRIE